MPMTTPTAFQLIRNVPIAYPCLCSVFRVDIIDTKICVTIVIGDLILVYLPIYRKRYIECSFLMLMQIFKDSRSEFSDFIMKKHKIYKIEDIPNIISEKHMVNK